MSRLPRSRFPSLPLALFAILLVLSASPVLADSGEARFKAFFQDLRSMRADFTQIVIDRSGELVEESKGRILVQRPGKFRLDYLAPYEQIYVADGSRLWVFDKDLDQVTVRPQQDSLEETPALLLSSPEEVDRSFETVELGMDDGMLWIELVPRHSDGGFDSMRLGFYERTLGSMVLIDSFGQLTSLEFEGVQRNAPIEADAFVFVPPPGVDVIGEVD